jgi:SAM-dependent methyltransferase
MPKFKNHLYAKILPFVTTGYQGYTEKAHLVYELAKQHTTFPATPHLLDIGCGTGYHSIELAKKGFKVTAIDISEDMLSYFKQTLIDQDLNKSLDISMIEGNFEDTNASWIKKNTYHLIMSFGSVVALSETLENISKLFSKIHHMLTDNGIFIFDQIEYSHVKRDQPIEWRELYSTDKPNVTFREGLTIKSDTPDLKRLLTFHVEWHKDSKITHETNDYILCAFTPKHIYELAKKNGLKVVFRVDEMTKQEANENSNKTLWGLKKI